MTNMKEDKIFNNKFNTGEIDFEIFGAINIRPESEDFDIFDEYNARKIQEDIYDIFASSKYYEEYSKNKKVPKSEIANVYYYFDERLEENGNVTIIDKFINVAEFMNISYEDLYRELGPVYKEKILRELDHKYQIFKKRNIKRLF